MAAEMARNTYEDWIPEEWGGDVVQRVASASKVDMLGRHEPMTSDTKHVPRSAGVEVETISKGSAYGEDTSTNDDVLLTARKQGKAIRIAEEDLNDTERVADILEVKKVDYVTSWGKYFDNATLAVTAAENSPTVPYTSVYYALSQNNSDTGYTANDNITTHNFTTSATGSYAALSAALADVEGADYFDPGDMVVIAHPAFRAVLRGITDTQNNPIFGVDGTQETLFGHPLYWSLGAKTSPTAQQNPGGLPIMVFANRRYLIVGDRENWTSKVIPADISLTDEAILKMRARKGFAVGHEKAFAIIVKSG